MEELHLPGDLEASPKAWNFLMDAWEEECCEISFLPENQCCGSGSGCNGVPGSKTAKWPTNIKKKFKFFIFWSARCSLLRAKASPVAWTLVNCNFWSKTDQKNFQLYFLLLFGHQIFGSGFTWNAVSGSGFNQCCGSGSGIRDPVPFWPLDPGSGIGFFRIPDLGSRIPNPYIWEHIEKFLGKNFKNSLKIGPNFFL